MKYDKDLRYVRTGIIFLTAAVAGMVIGNAIHHDWTMAVSNFLWMLICFFLRMSTSAGQKTRDQAQKIMKMVDELREEYGDKTAKHRNN